MLVNRTAARQFVMDYAKRQGRVGQIKRVSPEVYARMEQAARRVAREIVDRHPSSFRTLKP